MPCPALPCHPSARLQFSTGYGMVLNLLYTRRCAAGAGLGWRLQLLRAVGRGPAACGVCIACARRSGHWPLSQPTPACLLPPPACQPARSLEEARAFLDRSFSRYLGGIGTQVCRRSAGWAQARQLDHFSAAAPSWGQPWSRLHPPSTHTHPQCHPPNPLPERSAAWPRWLAWRRRRRRYWRMWRAVRERARPQRKCGPSERRHLLGRLPRTCTALPLPPQGLQHRYCS